MIDISYEVSLEIIEIFFVIIKIVKFLNIIRNIFIFDLNDFMCIRIIICLGKMINLFVFLLWCIIECYNFSVVYCF